jgi:hypothetical protein
MMNLRVKLAVGGAVAALALTMMFTAGTNSAATAAPKPAAAALAQPVLVELFTSQGCSSCPPADAFVRELARERGIVAISRPVTYWDRLGWKDTLARPGNDLVQRRYAARAIPGAGVYTPEIVVDGQSAAVGSHRGKIREMISAAGRKPAATIGYANGRVSVSGGAGTELRVLAVASERMVAIGNGENGGAKVGYSNVVVDEQVMRCTSADCGVDVAKDFARRAGGNKLAVIWQDANAGKVRAVRWVPTP